MHTLQCVVSALCSTALMAAPIAAPAFAIPVPASADEPWTVVPEETLRDMRGGIDLGALVANFAIMRVVQIDGVVVARMQIVITNLERLGNGGMPTISLSGPSAELVQIMDAAGNPGGGAGSALSTPASGAAASAGTGTAATPSAAPSSAAANIAPPAAPAVSAPAAASTPAAVSVPAAVSAPAAVSTPSVSASVATARSNQSSAPSSTSQVTSSTGNAGTVSSVAAPSTSGSSGSAGLSAATAPAAGTTQIVPLGSTGQVAVLSNLPNATALTTAIQNNVRAATIQVQTTISATLNSLSLLNASALASSIRQQVSKGP
jgi:hypothetical protein